MALFNIINKPETQVVTFFRASNETITADNEEIQVSEIIIF